MNNSITLYGAAANPQKARKSVVFDLKARAKIKLFETRDRISIRFGSVRNLDYRNYGGDHTSNVGDIALTNVVERMLLEADSSLVFDRCNWGELKWRSQTGQALIVSGGGYFIFDKNGRLPRRIKDDVEIIEREKIPLILFGVGVNRPGIVLNSENQLKVDAQDAETISAILGQARLISVRDNETADFLRRFTSKNVYIISDPALFYRYNKGCLSTVRTTTPSPISVGINIPFHGPTSTAILKKNFCNYVILFKRIQSLTNCRFKYFVHHNSEYIVPRLLNTAGVESKIVSGSCDNLLDEYSKLNVHIGGMLHSCILAHSVGVPAISISYDVKHAGFFRLFGLEENCFSALDFELERVVEKVTAILSNPMQCIERICSCKNEYKRHMDDFVEKSILELRKD